jgi:type IV pilus assembly protein PilM
VPSVPQAQLRETVAAESASQMGLDPQTTELRFLPAGDVRQGTAIAQEVIVLAAQRAAIEAHLQKLQEMGLTAASIDAPPCAVFRSFERFLRRDEDHSSAHAFLDIGYAATRILVSRGNELVFVKSIPIGGRRFDELMSMQMDLCISDAAKLRLRLHRYHASLMTGCARPPEEIDVVSDNMSRAMLDAIRPAIDHLGKEIAQSLRYCTATFRGPRAESVTVIGGEAFNTDMLQLLSDQINVPFSAGKPLRHIALEPALESSNRRTGQPEWATVLGLGLKPVHASLVRS